MTYVAVGYNNCDADHLYNKQLADQDEDSKDTKGGEEHICAKIRVYYGLSLV